MRTGAGERRIVRKAATLDAADKSASPRGIYLFVSQSLTEESKASLGRDETEPQTLAFGAVSFVKCDGRGLSAECSHDD
jgi:hypothetical protein